MGTNKIEKQLLDIQFVNDILPKNVSIHELIECGGQGIVYKGLIEKQESAIKIYFPGQLKTRIEREIIALRKIKSDSIVKLLWADKVVFSEIELQITATEYIPGAPLNKLIASDSLTRDDIGIIAYDIGTAINQIWRFRIVHRDLKPANILVRPNKRACVIDLGVARHISQTTLTALGTTWGTLGYLSPEQSRCVKQLTCKSDIYTCGIILLECLLGRHPTGGDQRRLEPMNLHNNLPPLISNWKHNTFLKRMLHPRTTVRPLPNEIIDEFKEYIQL